jgi:hypothetical protein
MPQASTRAQASQAAAGTSAMDCATRIRNWISVIKAQASQPDFMPEMVRLVTGRWRSQK